MILVLKKYIGFGFAPAFWRLDLGLDDMVLILKKVLLTALVTIHGMLTVEETKWQCCSEQWRDKGSLERMHGKTTKR